jgi:DNA-binding MarR family transcriptional regulator
VVEATRWLDEREQHAWRSYLAMTRLLAAQLDRELQRDSSLPHAYYEILVRLSEAPDRSLRMSELAQLSESSRSRLSHAVSRLVEAGWVRREDCVTDRRGAFAILTDHGFAALEAAAPAHVESVRKHLFDRLTSEQVGQLDAICGSVLAGLRDSGAAPECAENDDLLAEPDRQAS